MGGGSSKSSGRRSETEALHADVPFVLLKDDQACFRITSKGAVVTTAGAITAPPASTFLLVYTATDSTDAVAV